MGIKSKDQDFNFTLIDEIAGRVINDLYFENENRDIIKIGAPQLLGMYFKGVKKIQFVQEDKNTLKIKYVEREKIDPNKEIISLVMEVLKSKELEKDIKIIIEKVENIPVDSRAGKYRQIIPYKQED